MLGLKLPNKNFLFCFKAFALSHATLKNIYIVLCAFNPRHEKGFDEHNGRKDRWKLREYSRDHSEMYVIYICD